MLVLHDDADREFDYVAGAEKALDEAAAKGWTVVSVRKLGPRFSATRFGRCSSTASTSCAFHAPPTAG
jgi:hypothetical protein